MLCILWTTCKEVGIVLSLYWYNGFLMQLLRLGQRIDLFDEMYRRHVVGVVRDVESVGGQDEVEVVEEPFWEYLYKVNGKPGEK